MVIATKAGRAAETCTLPDEPVGWAAGGWPAGGGGGGLDASGDSCQLSSTRSGGNE